MHARITAFLPEQAALSHLLRDGERLRIGRSGDDCGLCVDHTSVSRRHAELAQDATGTWVLRDLGSKNGSHVDGGAVDESPLPGDAWLRFGDVYCEFELLDAARSAELAGQQQARRARATALTLGLQQAGGFSALLDGSLQAVMELGHCARGFLLLRDPDGGFAIRASQAIDPAQLADHRFSGSTGAVERVLNEGEAVVANDIGSEAWLSARDSVAAGGLRALVCLPLRDGGGTIGAIYADRTTAGPAITRLDQELLEAFAERAALYIAAQRASDALVEAPAPRWAPVGAGAS